MKAFRLAIAVCLLAVNVAISQTPRPDPEQAKTGGKPNPVSSATCEDTVNGIVLLRIVLLATGKIGPISVVKGLPNGLTEQAIESAKLIKYEPKIVNGVAQDVTKQVEYTFTMFYEEGSKELAKEAEITRMPAPKFPKLSDLTLLKTIEVPVSLGSDGKVEVDINKIKGQFPKEFKDAAAKAARGIKFKPAIHKCGEKVTETKIIKYEIN